MEVMTKPKICQDWVFGRQKQQGEKRFAELIGVSLILCVAKVRLPFTVSEPIEDVIRVVIP